MGMMPYFNLFIHLVSKNDSLNLINKIPSPNLQLSHRTSFQTHQITNRTTKPVHSQEIRALGQ